MTHPPIVAFCGPKYAGKGTAAKLLLAAGYVQVSFARPIKDMLLCIGLAEQDISDPVLKEQPHPFLGGQTPRWAMQSLGTEWGREMIYNDIWIDVGRRRMTQLRAEGIGVVLDDCRFDNEAAVLRELGVPIIEISRPGYSYNPAHKSEAGLSRHFITATVANDGTTEQLHDRLNQLLRVKPTIIAPPLRPDEPIRGRIANAVIIDDASFVPEPARAA